MQSHRSGSRLPLPLPVATPPQSQARVVLARRNPRRVGPGTGHLADKDRVAELLPQAPKGHGFVTHRGQNHRLRPVKPEEAPLSNTLSLIAPREV